MWWVCIYVMCAISYVHVMCVYLTLLASACFRRWLASSSWNLPVFGATHSWISSLLNSPSPFLSRLFSKSFCSSSNHSGMWLSVKSASSPSGRKDSREKERGNNYKGLQSSSSKHIIAENNYQLGPPNSLTAAWQEYSGLTVHKPLYKMCTSLCYHWQRTKTKINSSTRKHSGLQVLLLYTCI